MINNLNTDVPVAFTEYPRHQTFRGLSERNILRTDKYLFVPSIEYIWPLSINLGGHLFIDYLLVTDELNKISINNAPYAIGFGIDFHVINEELEKFEISFGSEGIHLSLDVGWSMN